MIGATARIAWTRPSAVVRSKRRIVVRTALAALGSREDAEDAAQDAFVTAWRKLDGFRGDLGRRMKGANRVGARYAVIFGEDELGRETATLRALDQGTQEEIPLGALIERLRA